MKRPDPRTLVLAGLALLAVIVGWVTWWGTPADVLPIGAIAGSAAAIADAPPSDGRGARAEPPPASLEDRRVDAALDGLCTLAGVVIDDSSGNPVPGLRVRWSEIAPQIDLMQGFEWSLFERIRDVKRRYDDQVFLRVGREVRTDADGRFRLAGVLPGTIHFAVTGPYHYQTEFRSVTLHDAEHRDEITLRVRPGGRVVGRVTDEVGAPLIAAEVGLFYPLSPLSIFTLEAGGTRKMMTFTDDEGRYVTEAVRPGAGFFMSVIHPGRPHATVKGIVVERGRDTRVDVTMPAGGTVTGRITGPAGEAVIGAELRPIRLGPLWDMIWESDVGLYDGVSDELGRYRIEGLPAGDYKLFARADGYAPTYLDTELRAAEPTWLGDIVMLGAGGVSGWVVDQDGRPVAGAEVCVTDADTSQTDPEELRRQGPERDARTPHTTTRADGTFRVEEIPVGTVRAWAGADGMAFSSTEPIVVVTHRETTGQRITLAPLKDHDMITGIVLDPAGRPVPEARVDWFYMSARIGTGGADASDSDGRFGLRVDHRVPHDMEVSDPQGRWAHVIRMQVEPGSTDLEFRFVEPRPFEVAVVDAQGTPVETFSLQANYSGAGHQSMLAFVRRGAHEGGVATFHRPTHPFHLEVDAPGYSGSNTGPHDPETMPERVTVRVSKLAAVTGVVMSSAGPVAGAEISLHKLYGGQSVTTSGFVTLSGPRGEGKTRTDDEGRFSLHVRGRAEFVIRAKKPDFATTEIGPLVLDGAAGAEGLAIEMGVGGSIEGAVLMPPGGDPSGVIIALNRGDGNPRTHRVGPDGAYRFEGLTPGLWQVVANDAEILPQNHTMSYRGGATDPVDWSCTVVDGGTTHFDLDLRDGQAVAIRGSLMLGGRPASGATASLLSDQTTVVGGEVVASTVLDGAGVFTLAATKPGKYKLSIRTAGSAHATLALEETLELAPGAFEWNASVPTGSLRGEGAPVSDGSESVVEYRWQEGSSGTRGGALSAIVRVLPEEDGSFHLPTIPSGAGRFFLYDPSKFKDYTRWIELDAVTVAPGTEETVDLSDE